MNRHSLEQYLGQRVVLDTSGPLLYIGRLEQFDETGYWLAAADVHDRSEGHSTKEVYVSDAAALLRTGQTRVNRRRVFVERQIVASVSALEDVVDDDDLSADDHLPGVPGG